MFSWVYIRYYQDRLESEVSTTVTAIFALTITLITSAMVPLDIFMVSYMKNSDGTFKVMQLNFCCCWIYLCLRLMYPNLLSVLQRGRLFCIMHS